MRKLLKNLFWTAVVLGAIGGILRATLFLTWTIPMDDPVMGASLAPNLAEGDLLVLLRATPSYGDLVRCADPDQPGRFVVGRLIGEQGDQITINGNDFTVSDKSSAYEMSCSPGILSIEDPVAGAPVELVCSWEVFRGQKHMRANRRTGTMQNQQFTATVSDGHIFLLSDNRGYPFDSRRYGAVPKTTCKESVVLRIKGKKGFSDEATRFTGIH